MPDKSVWIKVLAHVPQCPQRQDSMVDQLSDLRFIANRFGFYDAADYLKVFSNEETFHSALEDALTTTR
jgi:hypothetical protein